MKNLPNLFTLLNLVFGCMAIIYILQTGQTIAYVEREGFTSWNLPEKITWASLFIFAAAIVDFVDGFLARFFKSTSAMGKQLDSLADVVSFGVAPGLIMYQLLRISFAKEEGGLDVSVVMLLPSLLIPCAAAWRLAKFNLDDSQTHFFRGLPTPAAGMVVASLPIIVFYQQFGLETILTVKWNLYLIIILLSYLMVSRISMLSIKFRNLNVKENFPKYLLIVFAIISLIFLRAVAFPVVLVFYILVSLIFKKNIA